MSIKRIRLSIKSLFLITTLFFSSVLSIDVKAVQNLGNEVLSGQTITIFHTNDIHGNSGSKYSNDNLTNIGSDYLKSVKDSTPNSILVDAGDNTQGTAFAGIKKGAYSIEMMNKAGYDIATLGNHEFDYGLDQTLENIKNANFPFISANVLDNNGIPLTQRNDDVIKNNGCNVIKEVSGKKIGFFGITTTETASKSSGSDILVFENEIESSRNQVDELKSQGVDLVVGVMHVGCDTSSDPSSHDIAENVDGIDIIIDGHSHTKESVKVNNTVIQQTGCYGQNLGRIDISFDKFGEAYIKAKNITAKEIGQNYKADEEVRAYYNKLSEDIKHLSKVVAKIDTSLFGGYYNDLAVARIAETNLGDICADAMLEKAKQMTKEIKREHEGVVALLNGGAVRHTVSSGYVCLNDIYNVFPFENKLVGIEITPKDLFDILETSISSVTLPKNQGEGLNGIDGKFAQVAGIRFEFNPQEEVGEKVKRVFILDEQDKEKSELSRSDSDTKLVFVTNSYIANGKDGYEILAKFDKLCESEENIMDILGSYLTELTYKNNGEFSYPFSQNRIKMIKPAELFPNFDAKLTLLGDGGKDLVNKKVSVICDDKDLGEITTNENGEIIIENLETGSHLITVFYNDIKVYGMVSDNFVSDSIDTKNLTLSVTHDYDYDVDCVSNIISQIPDINNLSKGDENLVKFARSSYDSLREDLKDKVIDYNRLLDAENKLFNKLGWQLIDNSWYYFESGVMAQNRWILTNGLWYYLGEDGAMVQNIWILTNGLWYYLGENGAMVKNRWILTNGLWYYLNSDGAMAVNLWIDNYYVDNNGVWVSTR